MRSFVARIMFLIALLGLPVQAVAAATMGLCDHDHAALGQGHDATHGHGAHDTDGSTGNCDESAPCHHCTALALPCTSLETGTATVASHTPASSSHRFRFFPEQPKRPPLA